MHVKKKIEHHAKTLTMSACIHICGQVHCITHHTAVIKPVIYIQKLLRHLTDAGSEDELCPFRYFALVRERKGKRQ
jgi:hypothetical protein